MKILLVSPNFYPYVGGLEEQSFLLAREFVRIGHDVNVVTECFNPLHKKIEYLDGIKIIRTTYLNKKRNLLSFIRLMVDYSRIILGNKYDLFIIRTLTFPSVFIGMLKWLRLLHSRTVATMETGGIDDLCVLQKSLLFPIYKYFLGSHDYLNSVCDENYNHYLLAGFKDSKLIKIVNGIEIPKQTNVNKPKKVKTFLFLARLVKEKGLFELLDAFNMLSEERDDLRLVIGGDGPEKQRVLEYIDKYGLNEKIELYGVVTRKDKWKFFEMGDIFVFPSYSEGFGMVVYEAAAYKKRVIATDVADLRMVFGNSILYTEKRNAESLHKQMETAIEGVVTNRLDYDDFCNKFDIKNVALRYLKLASNDSV